MTSHFHAEFFRSQLGKVSEFIHLACELDLISFHAVFCKIC